MKPHKTRINDNLTAYYTLGTGPPIILVAGTGVPAATWPQDLLAYLSERREVITFDYRGTGQSNSTTGEYSTRQFADDAVALLKHLDAYPADVIGHSMGGRVAQWMALAHPEMIRRLVLCSTGPGDFGSGFRVLRGIPLNVALELAEQGYPEAILSRFRASVDPMSDGIPGLMHTNASAAQHYIEAFEDHGPTVNDWLRHVVARQCHQTAGQLSDILVPTLITVGDKETTTGGTGSHLDAAHHMASQIPGAELRIWKDQGHRYLWQDPISYATSVVEWLDAPVGQSR